jgi:hypothetical protein
MICLDKIGMEDIYFLRVSKYLISKKLKKFKIEFNLILDN